MKAFFIYLGFLMAWFGFVFVTVFAGKIALGV